MGPLAIFNIVLIGVFGFATLHHGLLWLWTRSRSAGLLSIYCALSTGLVLAIVAIDRATTIEAAQRALQGRVVFGLSGLLVLAWLIASLTGVRSRTYLLGVSVVLGAGVIAWFLGISPVGNVVAITPTPLPWGESFHLLERAEGRTGLALLLYCAVLSVYGYAAVSGWTWARLDPIAGWITFSAGAFGIVTAGIGLLIDIGILRAPYIGQGPNSLWILLATVLLSREHARRQQRLENSERRFQAIFDQTFQFIGLLTTEGRLLEANKTALEFAGIAADQVIGRLFWETPWWSHSPELQQQLREAVATASRGATVRFTASHPRPDGRKAYVDFSLKPVYDKQGKTTLLIPEGRDISEHVESEQLLRAERERLSTVIDNSPGVAMQWYDLDGRVVLWNRASEEIFGYSAEQAIGKTLDQLIHTPEEFRVFLESLSEIERTGQPIGPTEFAFLKGGTERRECVSTLFRIPGERGPLVVCMDIDITDRKRIERELQASEARYRTLIEFAPEAIVVFDVDSGTFAEVNAEACRLFGAPASQLSTLDFVKLSPPVQPGGRPSSTAAAECLDRAIRGDTPVFEWTYRTVAGRDLTCEVRLVRLPDPTRVLIRGSIMDIAGRRQLEEQLRQSQKMEAIGQLAGGVAHDFNNLLTVISGYAEILMNRLPEGDPNSALVKGIGDAAERAAWLTARLLAFGRRAVSAPQVFDLNALVSDGERILRRLIGEHIALQVDTEPRPLHVKLDPGQWSQVMLNLAINARDAMPAGGTLRITTRSLDADSMFLRNHPGLADGTYACFSVSDTGLGMQPEVRAHIFEPFFTTKEVGKGTGLGLAVVHGIVTQAGGAIDVETAPGAGTTFTVYLPAAKYEPVGPSATAWRREAGAGESILLVEDEAVLRELLEVALTAHGFTVWSASDGEDALRVLDRPGARVDLLVTDMVMPGKLNGRELAGAVRQRFPSVKVLFISGYLDDPALRKAGLGDNAPWLQKPFSLAAIAQKARETLDG